MDARLAAILVLHPTPGGKLTLLDELNNHVDKKVSRGGPNYDGDTKAVAIYRKRYTPGNRSMETIEGLYGEKRSIRGNLPGIQKRGSYDRKI